MDPEMKIEVVTDPGIVNPYYEEIKFKHTAPADFQILLSLTGKVAGMGRLVKIDEKNGELGGIYVLPDFRGQKLAEKIVSFLIEKNAYPVLWCLPFEPLESFYRKFGFTDVLNQIVPREIQEKLDWCEGRYPDKAILLVRSEE